MNAFTTLLKRELWENQSIFIYIPVGISLFMVLMMALSLFVMNVEIGGSFNTSSDARGDRHEITMDTKSNGSDGMPIRDLYIAEIQQLASEKPEVRREKMNRVLQIINSPLRIVLIFVIFYYLLGCLYEERKNSSILFWKSMPVSDFATIGSKLFSALVLAPAVFFTCILLTDICALSMVSIIATLADVSAWGLLWGGSGFFTHVASLVLIFFLYTSWLLPLIGWVLFVSSFANSVPLAWALGIPVGISIAEAMLLSTAYFKDFVLRHASLNLDLRSVVGSLDAQSAIDLTMNLDMLLGLVIGAIFIFLAVWKRGGSDVG